MTIPNRSRLANLLYPDPRPLDTAEQFVRAAHDDISDLDDEALDDERLLARLRRALTPRAQQTEWLRGRIAHLEREAARRRQRAPRVQ